MFTPKEIKSFLDQQHLACNRATLLSLYDACKGLAVLDAKLLFKNFTSHKSQIAKYGLELLLEWWY